MTKPLAPMETTEERLGHQPDVVNVPRILVIGVVLAAIVFVSMYGMVVLFEVGQNEIAEQLPDWAVLPNEEQTVGPELNPDQSADLRKLRERHEKMLSSYGWVDEEQGVAHIPIDRAIEVLTENPLPARRSESE